MTTSGTTIAEPCLDRLWRKLPLSRDLLEKIEASADNADRTGFTDAALLQEIAGSGLLSLPIPAEFEGAAGSAADTAAALRQIASIDPALAIALNMHVFSVAVLVEHWREHRDKSWILLEAIAGQNRLVASAFGEPGLNGSILRSHCRGTATGGGFVVSGVKTPCSFVFHSDLVCLQFEVPEEPEDQRLKIAMIPTAAPGLRLERSWDSIAMRASESDTLWLESCFIPTELVFYSGRPGQDNSALFARSLSWFVLGLGATYVGLMRRALLEVQAEARSASSMERRLQSSAARVRLGGRLHDFILIDSALRDLASRLDEGFEPIADLNLAMALRSALATGTPGIVADCMGLMGARTLSVASLMSRLMRDAAAAAFHPPNAMVGASITAQQFLGQGFTLDL